MVCSAFLETMSPSSALKRVGKDGEEFLFIRLWKDTPTTAPPRTHDSCRGGRWGGREHFTKDSKGCVRKARWCAGEKHRLLHLNVCSQRDLTWGPHHHWPDAAAPLMMVWLL
jgi:hypothetical protein